MEEDDGDRISQLPDPILQHILSFIDTKQAVQTTLLSTRWQNLWRSISDLTFTFSAAAAHSRINLRNSQAAQDFSHCFADFVSLFLSQRDYATTIHKFCLSFDNCLVHADAAFVEKCVYYAVRHGVETLHLHALCRQALRFPQSFSDCKTLRELKLKQFAYGLVIPKDFSLPHLNTLYLENSVFIDDGDFFSFSKEPFSRFPELEKLTLRRCTVYGLVIAAPKLRVLEIVHDKLFSEAMEEISTPMLTSFRYEGCFPLECSKVLEMDRRLIEQSPLPFPHIKYLKLTKGRREIPTVLERVMDYLTEGSLCDVEFPEGVCVVEKNPEVFDEEGELQLEHIFGVENETQSETLNFGAFEELLAPKFRQDGSVMF